MNPPKPLCTLVLSLGLLWAPPTLTIAQTTDPASAIDRAAIDPSVRPQDDFFRHVDGLWLKNTPIPPDRSGVSGFAEILEKTQVQLRALIEDAQGDGAGSQARQIGDLYTSFMARLAPALDWSGLLAEAGLAGKVDALVVRPPSYLTALSTLQDSTPLPAWKAYARTHLLHAYAPYLGRAFVDARFAFSGTALSGTPQNRPRWWRGVAVEQESLGEALGQLYVGRHFSAVNKARMDRLVAALLAAYKESIDTLDWMSPQTKKEAQAKLATIAPKIGYPKRWIEYSALKIEAGDLLGNVKRARAFEFGRQVAKLGGPVDRDEWHMTPQTVNAYYNATLNEIVFPAVVLQPPFFDPGFDDAVNYGAIGAVIGHEISHGFDDKGSQYDGQGNLRDWWSAEDRERFAAKTRALVAQYAEFEPVAGYKVNGELTLGENIADNSGLAIAYKAYRASLGGKPALVIDGLSGDARFFFGYAQVWRGKSRDEALIQRVKSDPHSPNEFRVNGAVRNHPGFYSTFDVKLGDKMYLPPQERVSIW